MQVYGCFEFPCFQVDMWVFRFSLVSIGFQVFRFSGWCAGFQVFRFSGWHVGRSSSFIVLMLVLACAGSLVWFSCKQKS